jgi:hypothetical protein
LVEVSKRVVTNYERWEAHIMAKYRVEVMESYCNFYEVTASSPDDAESQVEDWEGQLVSQSKYPDAREVVNVFPVRTKKVLGAK